MKRPDLTHEQRVELVGMLAEREGERHRVRAWALNNPEAHFDQPRWDLLGREMTLLRVLLGEYRAVPAWAEPITEAQKREFWQHCQSRFASAKVKASKPQSILKYEPRNDPSLAFGD